MASRALCACVRACALVRAVLKLFTNKKEYHTHTHTQSTTNRRSATVGAASTWKSKRRAWQANSRPPGTEAAMAMAIATLPVVAVAAE